MLNRKGFLPRLYSSIPLSLNVVARSRPAERCGHQTLAAAQSCVIDDVANDRTSGRSPPPPARPLRTRELRSPRKRVPFTPARRDPAKGSVRSTHTSDAGLELKRLAKHALKQHQLRSDQVLQRKIEKLVGAKIGDQRPGSSKASCLDTDVLLRHLLSNPSATTQHYNVALELCCLRAEASRTLALVREMKTKGLRSDIETFCWVIECLIRTRMHSQAVKAAEELEDTGLKPTPRSRALQIMAAYRAFDHETLSKYRNQALKEIPYKEVTLGDGYEKLLKTFLQTGRPATILEAMSKLINAGVTLTPSLCYLALYACKSQQDPEEAVRILAYVREHDLPSSSMMYTIALKVAVAAESVKHCTTIVEMAASNGIKLDIYSYRAILRLYSSNLRDSRFEILLNNMDALGVPRDVYTWDIILEREIEKGASEKNVKTLVDKMIQDGIVPSHFTFQTLLKGNFRSSLWALWDQHYMELRPSEGLRDDLLRLCLRDGASDRALAMINHALDTSAHLTIRHVELAVGALLKKGRYQDAFQVLERFHEKGCLHMACYATALAACKTAGRHIEAVSVIDKGLLCTLRDLPLEKFPSCSNRWAPATGRYITPNNPTPELDKGMTLSVALDLSDSTAMTSFLKTLHRRLRTQEKDTALTGDLLAASTIYDIAIDCYWALGRKEEALEAMSAVMESPLPLPPENRLYLYVKLLLREGMWRPALRGVIVLNELDVTVANETYTELAKAARVDNAEEEVWKTIVSYRHIKGEDFSRLCSSGPIST